jgi:hypothetical protein
MRRDVLCNRAWCDWAAADSAARTNMAASSDSLSCADSPASSPDSVVGTDAPACKVAATHPNDDNDEEVDEKDDADEVTERELDDKRVPALEADSQIFCSLDAEEAPLLPPLKWGEGRREDAKDIMDGIEFGRRSR